MTDYKQLCAELAIIDRRPQPKSLAEEALYALDEALSSDCIHLNGIGDTIRRALERLQELEGQSDG